MRLVVIGRTGQLARALIEADPSVIALGREAADLTDPAATEAAVAAARPDLVINAAAYTAVDRAESEPDLARAVNALGAEAVARGAARAGAGLIHVSTDYVFDGSKAGEWVEDDATAPLGVYGATKLEGERLAAAACRRVAIVRTAWVHSPWGTNFVRTMLRLAERERLNVVEDQRGKPTSALDLADALLAMAPVLAAAPAGSRAWGLYHYSGEGACAWADFAEEIFAQARARGLIARAPRIARIPTAEYPTPAARPANSALSTMKFEAAFGVSPVPWRGALARVLERIERDAA